MTDNELDRIIAQQQSDQILPSSGFQESVMNAVRAEAAADEAIPFPWKRALPGLLAAALVLLMLVAGFVVLLVGSFHVNENFSSSMKQGLQLWSDLERFGAGWTLLSLFALWLSYKLSKGLLGEYL